MKEVAQCVVVVAQQRESTMVVDSRRQAHAQRREVRGEVVRQERAADWLPQSAQALAAVDSTGWGARWPDAQQDEAQTWSPSTPAHRPSCMVGSGSFPQA